MPDDTDGIFGPPANPSNGLTYGWGNLVYEYSAQNGVWNIVSGSLIGQQGPPGQAGSPGERGTTGAGFTGARLNGDGTLTFQFEDWSAGNPARTIVNIGIVRGATGNNGAPGAAGTAGVTGPVGGTANQVLFVDNRGASGTYNFQFNGVTAHFGGTNTRFTMTGPTMQIGYSTDVVDGVFRSPREFSEWRTVNGAEIAISPSNGTIQRIQYNPQGNTVTIRASNSGWSSITGHTETIMCFIKLVGGGEVGTGKFGDEVLCESPRATNICNHGSGVTGTIDVVTLMRICAGTTAGGASRGLTMGFYVARGLTNSTDASTRSGAHWLFAT